VGMLMKLQTEANRIN